MMYSKYLSGSLFIAVLLAVSGCATTLKYPHEQISTNQRIGVYAHRVDPATGVLFANTLLETIQDTDLQGANGKLKTMAVHKLVLKEVLQSFPSRTNANVLPILSGQEKFTGEINNKFDPVATGKSLSLDYVMTLKVVGQLMTTGYIYREQWRPVLKVTAELTRVKDGRQLMSDSIALNEKPFLKFLSVKEQSEVLQHSYSKMAARTAKIFADNIGPVRRTIPKSEKMIHEKIYAFSRIRAMANKDNCIISGDLRKVTTDDNVLYHVPCRDIVLTYACDSESDNSRCWLQ